MSLLTYKNKENIFLNNKDISIYNLKFIDNNLEIEGQFGSSYSLSINNNILINKIGDGFKFSLRFIRIVNGEFNAMDDETFLRYILHLFNNEEVNQLQIGNKYIYCTTVGGRMIRQTKNNTIIEIDFESLSPYVYSKIYIKEYLVEANTPATLTYANTGREVPILLEIEASADGDFRIVNNSKNKTHPLSVSNMKANDIVTIDSDTMDITGIDRDRIVGSIKDVLTLKNGVNIFNINCTSQFKVILKWQEEYEVY